MPRNRVQHQKGLSDDAFERLYPDEEACRTAWFSWRWPEGFKCPRCGTAEYSEIMSFLYWFRFWTASVIRPGYQPSSSNVAAAFDAVRKLLS